MLSTSNWNSNDYYTHLSRKTFNAELKEECKYSGYSTDDSLPGHKPFIINDTLVTNATDFDYDHYKGFDRFPFAKKKIPSKTSYKLISTPEKDDQADEYDLLYTIKSCVRTMTKGKVNSNRKIASNVKKKVNFGYSTPKLDNKIDDLRTPSRETNILDTPISGIRRFQPEVEFSDSVFSSLKVPLKCLPTNLTTPLLNETSSPIINLPPEVKSTILTDVVCYVDCRNGKKNATESVKNELLSLGARVENNFTKKVTHVVFKEGRRSVYIQAKQTGIPIVGVLWIEACKKILAVADPSLYYPKKMKVYDNIYPFQMIKKRRIPILNPNSKVRKMFQKLQELYPTTSESEEEDSPKKVKTENKHKLKKAPENRPQFSRKLFIDSPDNLIENKIRKLEIDKENKFISKLSGDPPNVANSSTDNSLIKEAAVRRRKSAPGKLLSKRNARKEDIKTYLMKAHQELANETSDKNNVSTLEEENKENRIEIDTKSQVKIKKKLFDPNETFSQSQIVETSSLLAKISPKTETRKRPRTKESCRKNNLKVTVARKLQWSARKNMMNPDSPSDILFIDKSESQKSKKNRQSSIAFTSIPKEGILKYKEMVNKLGKYIVEEKVTKHTSHVVSNGPRRTLNLVKGIARGCWILDLKWLTESHECGKWLPEDQYDLSPHFPAAMECCKERRSLKSNRVIDIFKDAGLIYVSRKSYPSYKDVEELLLLCYANIASCSATAAIKVGGKGVTSTSAKHVSVKWVFDSISLNELQPIEDYLEK